VRAALITGGGSGIGAATARRLAADGWLVGVLGRRAGPLEAVAAETGGLALPGDAADPDALVEAVGALVDRAGALHGLVCAAGGGAPGTALEQTEEAWERVLRVNLTAPFLAARTALPHLIASRGAIAIVASLAGLRASPASIAYAASKAGAVHLARCLAVDHGPAGVRTNAVCPGWVRTPMADDALEGLAARLDGDLDAAYAEATRYAPDRRPAEASEVAAAIAWLLSDAASGVNGATLTIDGGAHVVDAETIAFVPPTGA
jgi:NAD(P)-dependent dehydrogenase (short-subunit alcohol dehydrogenase family)